MTGLAASLSQLEVRDWPHPCRHVNLTATKREMTRGKNNNVAAEMRHATLPLVRREEIPRPPSSCSHCCLPPKQSELSCSAILRGEPCLNYRAHAAFFT